MAQSRQYERNACFYLWVYRLDKEPQLQVVPTTSELILPISQKKYKITLKNLKTYLAEVLQQDSTIIKIEIERGSHVGSFERKA
jgi:hypothetical protein